MRPKINSFRIREDQRLDFVDSMLNMIQKSVKNFGRIGTMICFLNKDELHVVYAPFKNDEEKYELSNFIHSVIEEMDVDGYCFASECYYYNAPIEGAESVIGKTKKEDMTGEEHRRMIELYMKLGLIKKPSETEEKHEGVSVLFQTRKHTHNVMLDINTGDVVSKVSFKSDDEKAVNDGLFSIDSTKLNEI